MKKIISLLLSVATMLLLSVSIFATTATSVTVDFNPVLNADVPIDQLPFDTSINSYNDLESTLISKFTGSNVIQLFGNEAFEELSDIGLFSLNNTFPNDHTTYKSQEYLFVFSCQLPVDTTIDETTKITTESGYTGNYLFTDDTTNTAYFYIKFTPKSDDSEELKELNSSHSIDVTVTYDNSVTETPVYSVVITWGSMDFTYQPAFKGTWDPTKHEYSGGTPERWKCEENANAITVTNHSNAAITASFTFTPDNDYKGIDGTFYDSGSQQIKGAQSIASADKESGNEASSFTAFLELSNALTDKEAKQTKCGVVTVEISQ